MIAAPEFGDAEELLRQYSPSQWSKRIFASSDAVVMDHVNTLQGGSKAVLDEAIRKQGGKEDGSAVTLNVVHTSSDGATDEASLDIFYPLKKPERSNTSEGAERYPVVIYIHGGYWQALDKKSSCWHAKTFTENGIGFVAIGYDLCPSISFKDLNVQVNNGIAKVVQQFPDHPIYICGHSAGGHLAAMALCVDWKKDFAIEKPFVHGFVPVSGCFDLRLLIKTKENDALKVDESGAIQFSPVLKPISSTAVVSGAKGIIAFGQNESDEFKRISKNYFTWLKGTGSENVELGNIEILELVNEDHFTVIERLQQKEYELAVKMLSLILS